MRRTLVSLALFAMMAAFGASKAHAVILTYSYTGNEFTFAEAPFTTSDRITGSFTIDCGALGGGGDCSSLPYSDYASAVTSWSFTAGPFTLDSTPTPPPPNEGRLSDLELMTDAEGDIVFWFIQAYGGSQLLNYLLETSNYGIEIDPDGDPWVNANDYAGIGGATTSWAERIGAPGIWTVSEVSVSEPSTLATALLSLAVLLLLLWRLRALPVRVYGRPMAPQLES